MFNILCFRKGFRYKRIPIERIPLQNDSPPENIPLRNGRRYKGVSQQLDNPIPTTNGPNTQTFLFLHHPRRGNSERIALLCNDFSTATVISN